MAAFIKYKKHSVTHSYYSITCKGTKIGERLVAKTNQIFLKIRTELGTDLDSTIIESKIILNHNYHDLHKNGGNRSKMIYSKRYKSHS